MLAFQSADVAGREPDRHLDRERHGIVRKHEALKRLVAPVIIPYRDPLEVVRPPQPPRSRDLLVVFRDRARASTAIAHRRSGSVA